MASRPSERTLEQKQRAHKFLHELALPDGVYSKYLADSENFLAAAARFDKTCLPFRQLRWMKSKLFGRSLLIANFSSYQDSALADNNDAVAHSSMEVAGIHSPPAILTRKREGSVRLYRSILEHECVHIHQMLLGRMPKFSAKRGGPFQFLCEHTQLEFVAYYLQHFHWDVYDSKTMRGMGLEEWCCFRSYVSSLERTLLHLLSRDCKKSSLEDFLRNTADQLPGLLKPLGFSKETCQFYTGIFPQHLAAAWSNVGNLALQDLSMSNLGVLQKWLH